MLGKTWLWELCEVIRRIGTLWVVRKLSDSERITWHALPLTLNSGCSFLCGLIVMSFHFCVAPFLRTAPQVLGISGYFAMKTPLSKMSLNSEKQPGSAVSLPHWVSDLGSAPALPEFGLVVCPRGASGSFPSLFIVSALTVSFLSGDSCSVSVQHLTGVAPWSPLDLRGCWHNIRRITAMMKASLNAFWHTCNSNSTYAEAKYCRQFNP